MDDPPAVECRGADATPNVDGPAGDRPMRQIMEYDTAKRSRVRRLRWESVGSAAILFVAALLLWGCPESIDDEDLETDAIDESQMDIEVDIDGFEDTEGYSRPDYAGQRNPFRPDSDVVSVDDADDDVGEVQATDPLERHAVSSLELVTIISETAIPRAMFIAPGGMGHFAIEGDRIGQSGGVIEDIRANEVEIVEPDGATTIVELRERVIERPGDDELTEEERQALRELLGSEQGRQALGDEFSETPTERELDERFPGFEPPQE